MEPKNKIGNINLVPTSFKLLHRDQIALCFFITTCKIPSVIRWKPSLQLETITMAFFFILMCLRGQSFFTRPLLLAASPTAG